MHATPQHAPTVPAAVIAAELRRVFGRLKRRLRDQTDSGGLSGPQVAVLGLLAAAGEATVTTLAREEGMRPQSMGAIVATLIESGFLHGRPDPADGRQTILSLTAQGESWVQAGRAARQDWLTGAIETRLSAAQQEELGRAIDILKQLVET
jgi:DNA-binding MarR family transcriptional regulator